MKIMLVITSIYSTYIINFIGFIYLYYPAAAAVKIQVCKNLSSPLFALLTMYLEKSLVQDQSPEGCKNENRAFLCAQ